MSHATGSRAPVHRPGSRSGGDNSCRLVLAASGFLSFGGVSLQGRIKAVRVRVRFEQEGDKRSKI